MPRSLLALLSLLVLGIPAGSQEKKQPDKKVEPRVVFAVPLGATPGKTTKIALRGFRLEDAKDVKVVGGQGTAKIVGKGKAPVPDKNPDQVGDTQVEIELSLQDKLPSEPVSVVVVTPAGETKPHAIQVETSVPVVQEKEPNDGFRRAQELKLPVMVEGRIDRERDVDVFKIEGKAGQKVHVEVFAARHGSPLDAIVTIYDQGGQEIASNDDFGDSRDARIDVTLPANGVYYISLIDAHDVGDSLHVYRLLVK